jgi:hypothetical protein
MEFDAALVTHLLLLGPDLSAPILPKAGDRRQCEPVFALTSGNSPYTHFRRPLETGDVALVRAAAAELPQVGLVDALRIVWAFREDDQLYERAAVWWVGRFALEGQDRDLGGRSDRGLRPGIRGDGPSGRPGGADESLPRECGITPHLAGW